MWRKQGHFYMGLNVYDSKVTVGEGEAHVALLNMKALCLMVGKLYAELKFFFKCRSKVMVKVMRSKFKVNSERSCHKEHTCSI